MRVTASSPRVAEAVETELADGRQQPVAVSGVVELDQALVDQAGQGIEHVDGSDDVLVGGDRFGPVERERALEDGEAAQHRLVDVVEQVDAPRDRREQRLLPRQRGAGAAGEQPEGVVEAARQPLQRHRSDPCGGQFESERDAVEPGADGRDTRR